ncbi:ABC transporter ATP-binding protein [Devosia sp. SD17-2]|jgi:iron(III) transport system ATP-binding protein|uniref:ABC transporter ATP-binding protein n=1 Tax=Devosia sp. SD17-2 TaxID=2976459 RepID=UPI0023D87448|nr:ABC transporter ATP-binding protein [Devosia sp. SD17-2]WEJ34756.1 ABC transporter ATP-binding protein [Devosia sp. SD17-2]
MQQLTPILSIRDVSRRFGKVAALNAVSLDIDAAEIVCLVGHSGCGKSTLLRVIAGIEDIDGGSVVLGGEQVCGDGIFVEPEHRSVGLMLQDYALFPHMTARQNIGFGLKHLSRSEAAARVDDIIDRLGLGPLANRYPHMLSGGEQQRIALARTLAPRPSILLMDEPFSNLDRGLRDDIRAETISLLRGLGTTAIIVTHDPEEALAIGDKVVLMHRGEVIEAGTGEEIYATPHTAYAAGFFSQVNHLPSQRHGEWLETPLGRISAPALPGPADVFVRPRALSMGGDGVEAKILSRKLLGEIEEWSLELAGLPRPLVMRTTARHQAEPGAMVSIKLDPSDVIVIPKGQV